MLNFWFSSNDEFCADNYIYFRFTLLACVAVSSGRCICTVFPVQLDGQCRSEKWEVYLYGDFPFWWTVVVWKCCPGVCLRLGFHPIWQRITPSLSCATF